MMQFAVRRSERLVRGDRRQCLVMPIGEGAYPDLVKDRRAESWEDLARREPYFAVLTSEGLRGVDGNSVATTEFFETGEADVSALLSAIGSLAGREVRLNARSEE